MGFFYRTIRLLEHGIKPVFVFDGKPPVMKGGELAKRQERREEAQKALVKAEEAGKERRNIKISLFPLFWIGFLKLPWYSGLYRSMQ